MRDSFKPVTGHAASIRFVTLPPMIVLDDREQVIGLPVHTRSAGPLDLPADRVKPYYAAHRRFCELMTSPENRLPFQFQPREMIRLGL